MARAATATPRKAASAFRTISEAAGDLDLPQHVLRFWETKFAQVKPMKRAGGRRYYRPEDVELLSGIKHLLYDRGYTIKGVQKLIREKGVRYVATVATEEAPAPTPATESVPDVIIGSAQRPPAGKSGQSLTDDERAVLNEVMLDLLECKRVLDQAI